MPGRASNTTLRDSKTLCAVSSGTSGRESPEYATVLKAVWLQGLHAECELVLQKVESTSTQHL